MTLFTITGLPRSGTAWMSAVLSLHPECIGYHELVAYRSDWRDVIRNSTYRYVADCNTYAVFDNYDLVPDKRVYIVSQPEQSHRSVEIACRKKVHYDFICELMDAGQTWAIYNDPCYVIDREDIFTVDGCSKVWQFLFDEEAPKEKIENFIRLNIQHQNPHIVFGEGKKYEL